VRNPGRVSRTAFLSLMAVLLGGRLFDGDGQVWGTAVLFVLVTLATSALTAELTDQARRDRGPTARWGRTDTGIVVTLGVVAGLLAATSAIGDRSVSAQTAAAGFAALYLVLAGYFGFVRWRTMRDR
jgi:hypothetical protein